MLSDIERRFPGLQPAAWRVTSPATDAYNCVAWAVHDTEAWWWPGDPLLTYWPPGVERAESLPAFRAALATVGLVPCSNADVEQGFEKVAPFADDQGLPTHVARQLPSGRWTSKLGMLQDIEHELNELAGAEYGSVAQVLIRPAVR